jgi:acetyl-CoA synthetase
MNSSTGATTPGQPALLVGVELEHRLEELLGQEGFPAPAGFATEQSDRDRPLHAAAESDPNAFWAEQARRLDWDVPFTTVLDDSNPPFYRWFPDGRLNVSYNCLDRHVDGGRGDRVAFQWVGEEGEERAVTYADLLNDVQRLANALKQLGVRKGDVVGIYLPMIPEVVVAMLACARIGAPHNVVFGGFAPEAVKERMEVSDAKVLITVDCARRKGKTAPVKRAVDETMRDLDSLEHIVVVRHSGIDVPMREGRDVFYDEIVSGADAVCPAEPMEAEHPLFILYSSGSTAKPKGIVHTSGGYLTGVAATHQYVFDLDADRDVYWCSADVGWITGHSYIVYGPLANGATSVMYEGAPDYPHKRIWWELIERYSVSIFYTAPTAIRACMKWGAEHPNAHDLSSAAAARHRRRADQPKGVALVPRRDRPRALPHRRHLVADRNRPDNDQPASRGDSGQARFGDSRASCRPRRRGRRENGPKHPAGPRIARAEAAVAGDAPNSLRRR